MIRVVEIQYFLEDTQKKPSHLAFLSTVTDTFIGYGGVEVWASWAELVDWVDGNDDEFLDRVKGLCPKWFFKSGEGK